MRREKKPEKIKVFLTAAVTALTMAAVTAGGCMAPADTVMAAGSSASANQFETDDFSIGVTFGLDGNYRSGASLPVKVDIESLQGDFEGSIRLIVPGSTDYYDSADQGTAYEQDLLLTSGSPKEIDFSVINRYSSQYMYLEIEDSNGKLLLSQVLTLGTLSSEKPLVGILSDDYTALSYFNSVLVDTSYFSENAVILQMGGKEFPDSAADLDALSFLIINSFDTSSLSQEQQQAILDWVQGGGALILGTGADAGQTLSMFPADVLNVTAEGYKSGELSTVSGSNYGITYTEEDGIWQLSVEGGTTVGNVLTDQSLIWHKTYGSGNIAVTAFNLGMEPVTGWSYKDKMAAKLLSATADGYTDERMSDINYGQSYYSDISGASIYQAKEPNVPLVFLILLLFAVSAPVTYLILKKTDRRELIWLIVPAEAVVFTALLLISQAKLRITHPVESSVTVISPVGQDSQYSNKVYLNLLMPETGWTQIPFSSDLTNMKRAEEYYSYSSWAYITTLNDTETKSTVSYNVIQRESAEGSSISLKNDSNFDNTNLIFDSASAAELSSMLETNLSKTVKGVSGTITNISAYDLDHICIITYNRINYVGSLPAGETVTVEEENNRIAGYYYDIDFGLPYEDQTDEVYRIQNLYANIYTGGYMDDMQQNYNQTLLLGYVKDWDADYITDPKIKEYNAAVLAETLTVPLADYPDAVTGSLYSYADEDDGSWDPNDGELYELTAEPTVTLPDTVDDIYVLTRNSDENSIYGETGNTRIYAWNYQTGEYDRIFEDTEEEKFENGCPYIQDHEMKLKFECKYTYDDYAPFIDFVGGGVLNAGN